MGKYKYIIMLFGFFLLTAGLMYTSSDSLEMEATENVKIQEDSDGIWRIRDNNGNNKGTMRVKKNDKINWHAMGSAMEFRFHKDVNAYFNYESGMFANGKTQMIEKSKMLRLTLKENAPQDTLTYDIYVVDADTFVVGNSPPILIIR